MWGREALAYNRWLDGREEEREGGIKYVSKFFVVVVSSIVYGGENLMFTEVAPRPIQSIIRNVWRGVCCMSYHLKKVLLERSQS